ncbi:hypothetical protein HXX76_010693 [Chlamydomonas incerta]|uniref:Uncharacterized protein n=1 Tax=Chlamydomonas incerta TaxID=51695 RepID=A0A835VXW1_CHLIN|nr:hypothetical protein HXX76_010693 [Chlamydomonas incerta]|eukprot:KAG2429913.1 hypothetical protein HXX76_010693 [Chlamydomonas incerta]
MSDFERVLMGRVTLAELQQRGVVLPSEQLEYLRRASGKELLPELLKNVMRVRTWGSSRAGSTRSTGRARCLFERRALLPLQQR